MSALNIATAALLVLTSLLSSVMRNEPKFALAAGIARAAKLLGFDQALAWAVAQLEKTWSVKVADVERGPLEHAQEALELSRITEMPTIRKRALYELMRVPGFGQIEDSSTLSISDYRILTHAREQCARHWTGTMKRGPTKMATNCSQICPTRKESDQNRDARWRTLMSTEDMMWRYYLDPVGGYGQLKSLLLREAGSNPTSWCVNCHKEWEKEWTIQQENLWKNLDEWFEL